MSTGTREKSADAFTQAPEDPGPRRADSLQRQIGDLKEKIVKRLSDHRMPSHTHLHMVLSILQKAEVLSQSHRHKKRQMMAWYEMMKAELLLYHQDSFCRDVRGAAAQWERPGEVQQVEASHNGHHPPVPVETTLKPEDERTRLKRELDRVWHEVMLTQRQQPQINMVNAANWLKCGEMALSKPKPDLPHVKYCLMRASASLATSQECAEWGWWGVTAICLELVYLFLVPVVVITLALQISAPFQEAVRAVGSFVTALHVPRYAHMWGFIGGVSWCLYNATYWTKQRLFDRHYLSWYVAHPWISSALGGVAALIFIGGLNSLTGSKFESDLSSTVGASLVSLVSFFAGFSTHAIWQLLDVLVVKLFRRPESDRIWHEKCQKEMYYIGD